MAPCERLLGHYYLPSKHGKHVGSSVGAGLRNFLDNRQYRTVNFLQQNVMKEAFGVQGGC